MNIDERLESLAHSVERMAQEENVRHKAIDETLDRIAQNQAREDEPMQALAQTVELLGHMQMKNETLIAQVMGSVNSLGRIAHTPEQRIAGLEDHG